MANHPRTYIQHALLQRCVRLPTCLTVRGVVTGQQPAWLGVQRRVQHTTYCWRVTTCRRVQEPAQCAPCQDSPHRTSTGGSGTGGPYFAYIYMKIDDVFLHLAWGPGQRHRQPLFGGRQLRVVLAYLRAARGGRAGGTVAAAISFERPRACNKKHDEMRIAGAADRQSSGNPPPPQSKGPVHALKPLTAGGQSSWSLCPHARPICGSSTQVPYTLYPT